MLPTKNFMFYEKNKHIIMYATIKDNLASFDFKKTENTYESCLVEELSGTYIRKAIFEYYGINFINQVYNKNMSLSNAMYFIDNFPNDVIVVTSIDHAYLWYADVIPDELETMIELMGD